MGNTRFKFRAWDGKKMYLPEYCDKEDFHLLPDGTIVETHEYGYERHELTSPRGDNWLVMQYTGLKDKNGVEIYESDIVRFVGGTTSVLACGNYADQRHQIGTVLVVNWLPSGFTLRLPRHLTNDIPNLVGNVPNYDLWNHAGSLEVIGNIHQNPELLNP